MRDTADTSSLVSVESCIAAGRWLSRSTGDAPKERTGGR